MKIKNPGKNVEILQIYFGKNYFFSVLILTITKNYFVSSIDFQSILFQRKGCPYFVCLLRWLFLL